MDRRRDIDAAAAAARAEGSADVTVHADNFEPGLRLLEGTADASSHQLREVTLVGHRDFVNADDDDDAGIELQSLRRSYARFVALLERCGRDGVRAVRFEGLVLRDDEDGDGPFGADDQQRLFGEVLPSLPNLKRVYIDQCFCPEARLATFASGLSARSSLVELDVNNCYGNVLVCVPAIAAMIRRKVPLQVLKLNCHSNGLWLEEDACRQIFGSLQHNSNLRRLEVKIEEVYEGAPILPTNRASALRSLRICIGSWTVKGKSCLAAQLKANAVLEDLHIVRGSGRPLPHRAWIEVLESHNHTLLSLEENAIVSLRARGGRIRHKRVLALLRRNRLINEALDQLKTYQGSPAALWPRLLGMASALPALLCRLLQCGESNEACNLLAARRRQLQRHHHRRRRIDPPTNKSNHKRSRPNPPP